MLQLNDLKLVVTQIELWRCVCVGGGGGEGEGKGGKIIIVKITTIL